MSQEIQEIKIGDRVRSYDFQERLNPDQDCYVEGIVEDITDQIPGPDGFLMKADCERYVLRRHKRIFGGEDVTHQSELVYYPPVNGTPTWLGGVTNCVKKVVYE